MNVYPQHGPDSKVVMEMSLSEAKEFSWLVMWLGLSYPYNEINRVIEQLEGNNG